MSKIKLPLHKLILKAMKKKILDALASSAAREYIIGLGDLLDAAKLPTNDILSIVSIICGMATELSYTGDEGDLRQYLEELATDLEARLDVEQS